MKNSILKLLILLIPYTFVYAESFVVHGHIYDNISGKPIHGANIIIDNVGTYSDEFGAFKILTTKTAAIRFVLIGYKSRSIKFTDNYIKVFLEPEVIKGVPVEVTANRVVPGVTPTAYSNLTISEISNQYSVEDVPMILSSEPGIHAYSESGNGTGYSYVSIRGFDQSRISVLLDNVPLNDTESHQVYWVDHGDILADASDVEIQRGIGNSLYGSTAFGGSINIQTLIRSQLETFSFTGLRGSYGTYKGNIKYSSGDRLGDTWSITSRLSSLKSDGYRDYSKSNQSAFTLGIEHVSGSLTNQFRLLIGKEISQLQWDGISEEMLSNRNLRTGKMDWTVPFTDDFSQNIYSLNTTYNYNPNISIRNVAYLVKGSGFYEVEKFGQDYYSYNLDVNDEFTDDEELYMEADFIRRKWIKNKYYGIVPTLIYKKGNLRTDFGFETRTYTGDHFGELMHIFDPTLRAKLPYKFQYYKYKGSKESISLFGHVVYSFPIGLNVVGDWQMQKHHWNLKQEKIGHAEGHKLTANWIFTNPRFGFTYDLNENISIFTNYGTAEKEPSDAQIIEADDVWAKPKETASEKIIDKEAGINFLYRKKYIKLNFYRINYLNEIISDIYDFTEGEFDIKSADKTRHEGFEIESGWEFNKYFTVRFNGSWSKNRFTSGSYVRKTLTNVPSKLANITIDYSSSKNYGMFFYGKYVGKQYIDVNNTEDIAIDQYLIFNYSGWIQFDRVKVTARINNIFNTLYATYGYEYYGGYYWPGATRNFSLSIKLNIL